MRIFILANGEAKRWGNYLGVDKQLLEIDGEPLLYRTVRLLRENGFDDIYIVGKYVVKGAKNFIPKVEPLIKHNIAREKLDGTETFALLYGDCYYTEAIIRDLKERKTDKEHLHWSCQRPNKYTGKPYVEGYIHAIYDKEFWNRKMEEYESLIRSGKHQHTKDWQPFRYAIGTDLYKHEPELYKDYEVDWEDETDDFDFPIDYDRWMKNVKGIDV